jgi:hypothetical protein
MRILTPTGEPLMFYVLHITMAYRKVSHLIFTYEPESCDSKIRAAAR